MTAAGMASVAGKPQPIALAPKVEPEKQLIATPKVAAPKTPPSKSEETYQFFDWFNGVQGDNRIEFESSLTVFLTDEGIKAAEQMMLDDNRPPNYKEIVEGISGGLWPLRARRGIPPGVG